jgi:threonine/homoserine/homoserine lactone efflux protein
MPSPAHLAVFALAALALLLVPGPAVLYVVTQSIDRGRRAGLASVGGIFSGTLVHIAAATVGLSALLASSAVAFDVVKYAGAAYLIVVGLRRLLGREAAAEVEAPRDRSLGRLYRQGIVVNVLNPKTALFFFAFLPQFVDPSRSAAPQIAVLGLLWVLVGLCSDGLYAVLSGTVGAVVRGRPGFARVQRWVTAFVLIGLGIAAALTSRKTQHA